MTHTYEVTDSSLAFQGRVIGVRRDIVTMPDGGTSQRDVVVHPGAVGVVALDERERVLLLRQYRHPVGEPLWELPAGLLDVEGEPGSKAAARELAEEAGLRARTWALLVDAFTSPGMTNEAIRLYLARDITEIPARERYVGVHEEAELELAWIDLTEATRRVLDGKIVNAMAIIGVLAAHRARELGFDTLRPATSDWPARPGHSG